MSGISPHRPTYVSVAAKTPLLSAQTSGAMKPLIPSSTIRTAQQVASGASQLTANDIQAAFETFKRALSTRFDQITELMKTSMSTMEEWVEHTQSMLQKLPAEKQKSTQFTNLLDLTIERLEQQHNQIEIVSELNVQNFKCVIENTKTITELFSRITTLSDQFSESCHSTKDTEIKNAEILETLTRTVEKLTSQFFQSSHSTKDTEIKNAEILKTLTCTVEKLTVSISNLFELTQNNGNIVTQNTETINSLIKQMTDFTAEKPLTLFQYADSLISSALKFIGSGAIGAAFMHYWNSPVSTQHSTNTATLTNNTTTEETNNLDFDVVFKNETSLNIQANNLTNNTFENLLAPSNSSLITNTTNPTIQTSPLDLSQCPVNAYDNTTTYPGFSDSLTKPSSSRFDLPQFPARASGNTTTYLGFSDSLPKPFSRTNTSNLVMDDQPALKKPSFSMQDFLQCSVNAYGNISAYAGHSDSQSTPSTPLLNITDLPVDNTRASLSLFDRLQNPLEGNLTNLALLTTVVALGYFARKTISSYFTSIYAKVTTEQKKQSFSIVRDWRALLGE